MLALLRSLLVLAVSLAIHVSYTSPSSSSLTERAEATGMSERLLQFSIRTNKLLKGIFWAMGVGEVSAIAADTLPFASRRVAAIFLKDGSTANLNFAPVSVIGALLIIFGGWVRWKCYRTMKSFFTFELSIRKDHRLVTAGPYSFVRHPGYGGMLAVHLGMYCWYASEGSWLRESGLLDTSVGWTATTVLAMYNMGILVSLLLRVRVEDTELRKVFGAQWDEWALHVRYTVIPGFI